MDNLPIKTFCLLFILFFFKTSVCQVIAGQVVSKNGKPLAFATIKFGKTQNGIVADLDGRFTLNTKGIDFLEISYLNYQSRQVYLTGSNPLIIELLSVPSNLQAVVVKSSTGNKLKRILNNAIENRDRHNPDKYDWYQCKVYYKMTVDVVLPDSVLKKDTSSDLRRYSTMMESQHLMVTETYSRRTWQRPASLQEDVIASRISGLKKAAFANLVTNVLPFHAYNNFIYLNGRDFKNPLSNGLFQNFSFSLHDELLQGADTVWVIHFTPKKNETELSGTLYINSDGFALEHLLAHAVDTILKRDIGIEQQYSKQSGRWFPEKLNYIFKIQPGSGGIPVCMKGSSLLDSVSYDKQPAFHFDKAHTTRLLSNATETKDSSWKLVRPRPLQPREARTYVFMDSIGNARNFDKYVGLGSKLTDGKFSVGKYFDLNLSRLFVHNNYEKNRIGWGMQTNDAVFKKLSIGGWVGYGLGDKKWKYGGFAECYLDEFKEFRLSAAYSNDISDPGRLQVNKEVDQNFLRAFLLSRVDQVKTWSASVSKKMGYLTAEAKITQQKIVPQYAYGITYDSKAYQRFNIHEASLNLRYAYGETTSPVFGRYYTTGSRYPTVYGRLVIGKINDPAVNYVQAVGAIKWQKNINRFGLERFQITGAVSFLDKTLPISKLFAGNGFAGKGNSFYVFGGMQTISPYEYYSDRFVNFYWMHDFTFRFYHTKISKSWSSAPRPSIGYNVLWGSMKNKNQHQFVAFKVPDKPYHECGVMINGLLRLNFLGIGYASVNSGYFYHFASLPNSVNIGRWVVGLGMDL